MRDYLDLSPIPERLHHTSSCLSKCFLYPFSNNAAPKTSLFTNENSKANLMEGCVGLFLPIGACSIPIAPHRNMFLGIVRWAVILDIWAVIKLFCSAFLFSVEEKLKVCTFARTAK